MGETLLLALGGTFLGVIITAAVMWGSKSRAQDDLQRSVEDHTTRLNAHDMLLSDINRQLAILNTTLPLNQKNLIEKMDDFKSDLVFIRANCRYCTYREVPRPTI